MVGILFTVGSLNKRVADSHTDTRSHVGQMDLTQLLLNCETDHATKASVEDNAHVIHVVEHDPFFSVLGMYRGMAPRSFLDEMVIVRTC
jgi:hypothetical protein